MASQAFFQSNSDATRRLNLDVDAIGANTTRTLSVPNRDMTLGVAADVFLAPVNNLVAENVQAAVAELRALFGSYTPSASLAPIATSGSASDLSAGIVPNSRLSAQVGRTDLSNTWAETQLFQKPITVQDGGGNNVFDVTTNQIRFRSAVTGYILSPSGQILAGEDAGGFYFAGGFTSATKPIYLGQPFTTQIIANAQTINNRTSEFNIIGVDGTGWGAFRAGQATFTGPASFVDSGSGSCRIDGRYITFPGTDGYISGSGKINIEDGFAVNGDICEFMGNRWHLGGGNQRVYFGYDSTTYLQGHGSTPFILRNGSDENIVTISSTGGATFSGVVTVNGLTLPGQNAYTMRLTCTGDRAFKWEGEASGSDYTTTFSNAGAGKHNITVSGAATFNGPLSSQGVTVTKASEGAIALAAGGTGNTGYLAFFKPNSTRQGFIGFDSGNDISFTNEQSGIFTFNKGALFGGTVTVNSGSSGRVGLGPDSYIEGTANDVTYRQAGSGSSYVDFGTSTVFRRTSDFATMATLTNGGDLFTRGSLTAHYGLSIKEHATGNLSWILYRNDGGPTQPLYLLDAANSRAQMYFIPGNTDANASTYLLSKLYVGEPTFFSKGINVTGPYTHTHHTSPPAVISYEYPFTRHMTGDGSGYTWAVSKRAGGVTTDLLTVYDPDGSVRIAGPTRIGAGGSTGLLYLGDGSNWIYQDSGSFYLDTNGGGVQFRAALTALPYFTVASSGNTVAYGSITAAGNLNANRSLTIGNDAAGGERIQMSGVSGSYRTIIENNYNSDRAFAITSGGYDVIKCTAEVYSSLTLAGTGTLNTIINGQTVSIPGAVGIGGSGTAGSTDLLTIARAPGWGATTFRQSYDSAYFASGKTFALVNDSGAAFALFTGSNDGSQTNLIMPNGAVTATGFGVGVAADASLPFRALASSNATVGMLLNNTSTGSSASSVVIVQSDAGQAGFRQYSAAHSVWPGWTVISSPSGGNGLALITSGTGNPIDFHTDNTLRATISDTGMTVNGTVTATTLALTNGSDKPLTSYRDASYSGWHNGTSLISNEAYIMGGNGHYFSVGGTNRLEIASGSQFNGALTVTGYLNIGSADCRMFRGSGNFYFESDGNFSFQDTSTAAALMLLANDGNLTTIGTVTSSGSRPVTLNGASGFINHVGDSGGWAQGSSFAGPNGTNLAEIGVVGTNNTAFYGYIGPFASPWLKIVSGGFLELPSSNRIFQDSGNLYIESDGEINLRDYSSGVSLWKLANDGRTFAEINVWHSDNEGNPRIVYNGSGGATNFYGDYDFVSSDRGHGLYSDGSIRWGSNAVSGNNRGYLSWDTDKAQVGAPLNLDIISGGTTRYIATSHEFNSTITSLFSSSTSDLSTLDLSAGQSRLHKNTTSGDLKLFANDGGTIKTITLT